MILEVVVGYIGIRLCIFARCFKSHDVQACVIRKLLLGFKRGAYKVSSEDPREKRGLDIDFCKDFGK